MFDLTPAERRGAFVLLALCALGATWDLLAPTRPAPPVPDPGHAASAVAVPDAPAPPAAAGASGEPVRAPAPTDLNAAGPEELDRLPGIGPVLARRIVERRARFGPFRSLEELRTVQGIGPRLLERLRPLVRAGESRSAPVHDAIRPSR